MTEAQLYPAILLALSRGDTRLFRINAGQAWAGTIIERTARKLVLLDYHPVRLAPEGFSDIAGYTTVAAREGERIAQFVAIEAKHGRNRATPVQQSFVDAVNAAGGRAGVAYSVEDAIAIAHGRSAR